jgi:hypothetical protein
VNNKVQNLRKIIANCYNISLYITERAGGIKMKTLSVYSFYGLKFSVTFSFGPLPQMTTDQVFKSHSEH